MAMNDIRAKREKVRLLAKAQHFIFILSHCTIDTEDLPIQLLNMKAAAKPEKTVRRKCVDPVRMETS